MHDSKQEYWMDLKDWKKGQKDKRKKGQRDNGTGLGLGQEVPWELCFHWRSQLDWRKTGREEAKGMRSPGSSVFSGGWSWTEGRQAEVRLRSEGPLGDESVSLSIGAIIDLLDIPSWPNESYPRHSITQPHSEAAMCFQVLEEKNVFFLLLIKMNRLMVFDIFNFCFFLGLILTVKYQQYCTLFFVYNLFPFV